MKKLIHRLLDLPSWRVTHDGWQSHRMTEAEAEDLAEGTTSLVVFDPAPPPEDAAVRLSFWFFVSLHLIQFAALAATFFPR